MAIARYFRLTVTGVNLNYVQPWVAEMELRAAADGTGPNLSLTGNGTATASSEASVPQAASAAFDNNSATYWTPTTANSGWLQWDFGQLVNINHVTLQNQNSGSGQSVISGYINASEDGVVWKRFVTLYSMNITAGAKNAFTSQPLGGAPGIPLPSPYQIVMYGGGNADTYMPKLFGVNYAGATGAATLPTFTLSASGADKVLNKGSASVRLSAVGYGAATANISILPTLSITGAVSIGGKAGLVAPSFTAKGTGVVASGGGARAIMPMAKLVGYSGAVLSVSLSSGFKLQATGATGSSGKASITLPLFSLTASGGIGIHGSLDVELPLLSPTTSGAGWMALPSFKLTAIGTAVVTTTYEAYAVNLGHTSDTPIDEVSHYTNFPFDRIVRYKNSYFGMNATGLYLLEGTTDNGAATNFAIQTHQTDFDMTEMKTVVSMYMGGRIGAAETVSIIAGEKTPNVYNYTTPRGPLAQNYRQKFGLGIKSRYYAFAVSGKAEFKLDTLDPEVKKLTRSI